MAERRMFSKKIINSARFLKMPSETQNLYFHLGINADDDGVVEAFNVMRMVGSTEDSLKLLMAKGFINVLNEDLVSHVTDWLEHNKIRADRKVDSMYKDLLLQVVPDAEVIEPKQRKDRQPKATLDEPKLIGTSQGQPKDSVGEDRIGKDRLGKVSSKEDRKILEKMEVSDSDLDTLIEFMAYRRSIKDHIKTKRGLTTFLNNLNEIKEQGYNVNDAINLMYDREWKTVSVSYLKNVLPKQQGYNPALQAMKQRLQNAQ